MQLLLPGRSPRLDDWVDRPFPDGALAGSRPGDRRVGLERDVGGDGPGDPRAGGVHARAAAAVLAADLFPRDRLAPVVARAPVEVGDVVGLRYRLAPGVELFFASRVVARFDERTATSWRTGFTWRTLVGHPLEGEETVAVEKDRSTGRVRIVLRSWSRPGRTVARLAPRALRAVQGAAARAALDHLAARAAEEGAAREGAAGDRAAGDRAAEDRAAEDGAAAGGGAARDGAA